LQYLEAQGNYLRVVTTQGESLVRFRISEAVSQLSEDLGMYLHRSRWVAFAGVRDVSFAKGLYQVNLNSGETISVASTRASEVIDTMTKHGISVASGKKGRV